jgi:signal transduction histidine kinase
MSDNKIEIEAQVKSKIIELSIRNEIDEVLMSTRQPDEILHIILIGTTAQQGLGFNRSFLLLINEKENTLEGRVATGPLNNHEAYTTWGKLAEDNHSLKDLLISRHGEISQEDEPINMLVRQIKVPLSEDNSIFTQAIFKKKSLNIEEGTPLHQVDKELFEILGINSFALVPLICRDKPLGVILADNFITKKPITDNDLTHLRAFANNASLAIENSRLYDNLKEKIEELSKAYNELKENRDKLLRYERLSAIGEMSAKVAHDIRNPLTIIGGFTRRIMKKNSNDPINSNYLSIIVKEIDRLEKILNDILSYAKIQEPQFVKTDLNRIIKTICEIFIIEMEQKNVFLLNNSNPDLPFVLADPGQIERVLINIIENAIEAMPTGGQIEINTFSENGWANIEIADSGKGISDDDMDKLFAPFFSKKPSGCGLGLTVSSQIIKNHGGNIGVRKREPNGTVFFITLPIADSSVQD